jgi:hypothetical protein
LRLVNKYVEKLGGKITAESVFGEGTTMSFTVQLQRCSDAFDRDFSPNQQRQLERIVCNSIEFIRKEEFVNPLRNSVCNSASKKP